MTRETRTRSCVDLLVTLEENTLMKRSLVLPLITAACSIAMLSACSGGMQSSNSGLPSSPAASHTQLLQGFALPTGVDTRYSTPQSRIPSQLNSIKPAKAGKDLFVSSGSTTVVILANETYKEVGTLSDGITESDGVWVDSKGNVYVANAGSNVVEYAPGGTSPTCTYTGATDPINVATDSKGNVYVADFNLLHNPGYIDEYAQCTDTIEKQWPIDEGPEGVAVDKKGDIFVAYFNSSFHGSFEEFVGGSSTATQLGATVGSPAGLILDKNSNLIADDQTGYIDVIAPPYSSATALVTGLSDPFHCSLAKKENLLFNANAGSAEVGVYSYPSGSPVTTLGSSNGISAAEGVGDSPNSVF
jgi:hypothetical protein